MRHLRDILPNSGVTAIHGPVDIVITSLHQDSRAVQKGALFFAVRGTASDGHLFIPQAINAGAVAVICENMPEELVSGVTYCLVGDTSRAQGYIASNFYGNPSSRLQLIGITGTNGKTTTATLLEKLFTASGYKTGLISTILYRINGKERPSTHTTPDSIALNAMLAEMVEEGCSHCFMEVSSHAVTQNRIAGLTFRGGVFTNLTHDHLDYHKDFPSYLKAKKTFFDELPEDAFALTNKDDRNGLVMLQNSRARKRTYSMMSMADFRCRILENTFHGLHLVIDETDSWFRLIGAFNAYNILAVYATAVLLGHESRQILTLLSGLEPVNGRFNNLRSDKGITAIIDYAHTPDALRNVLETINSIRSGNEKLITVAGAGGNRDSAKRPVMANIASRLSNTLILTSDNPRFEDPEAILEDMKKGVEPGDMKKLLVIVNRKEAIKTACALADPGDIILVAGKGHETYQDIKGIKYPFDDKKILAEILNIE